MSYSHEDYWQEAFEIAMDEAGCGEQLASMSKDQRAEIGRALCAAAENQGMAFHVPANPLIERNRLLERQLEWERELWACEKCGASGRIITPGPYHSSDSQCWKCSGAGKYHPRGQARPT